MDFQNKNMTKTFKLNRYNRSVGMILRQTIISPSGIDPDREYPLDTLQLQSYLNSPQSHSIKSVGPKTVEFICKEFSIQPPDAWKIRIDKYHEDRKDKDERKRKKERYVTVKISKIDADELVPILLQFKATYLGATKLTRLPALLDKVIIPLQQKFDWKE